MERRRTASMAASKPSRAAPARPQQRASSAASTGAKKPGSSRASSAAGRRARVARQPRREGHHLDDQLEQLRLGQEQRLQLHARRQAGEEVGEAVEGRVRRAGGLAPASSRRGARRVNSSRPALGAGRGDAAVVPGADGRRRPARGSEKPIRARVASVSGSSSTPVNTRLPKRDDSGSSLGEQLAVAAR